MNSKLTDAIYGLAIGDALGVPYEFCERGTFTCEGMTGYGSHRKKAGTWSDDTAMTLATLKSLKEKGSVDIEDIRKNFLLWIKEGAFTQDGRAYGIGHTTWNALVEGRVGTHSYENGNGSLMRILPLVFTESSDEEVREVSAVTHAHYVSKEACVLYVQIGRELLKGREIKEILGSRKFEHPFERLGNIWEYPVEEIKSSGYVLDTLEAALWCLSNSKSYEETVLKAVNLGGDTDSIAAVAGGLAGIVFGLESEKAKEWKECLYNRDIVERCLGDEPKITAI